MAPVWSPDGRELFYDRGNAMMAVPVETKTSFSHGTPRVLFQRPYVYGVTSSYERAYDIAPDGRFLMLKEVASTTSAPPDQMIVVLNWTEELKRRVPRD
jgi:hypothetical protein